MCEIDRGELDALRRHVLPDVELGPVGKWEDADVLALAMPPVVQVPELGPLVLGVPLAEVVAEAEDPLLGPSLLLVAPGATEHGVEAVRLDGLQQHHRLEPVPARPGAGFLDHLAGVYRVLDAGHRPAGRGVGGPAGAG